MSSTRPAHFGAGSLRGSLALAFAGIALVGALGIGAALVPILSGHYATAELTYLEAAAERAVRDLSAIDWGDRAALAATTATLASVTQGRVTVRGPAGSTLAVAGPPAPGDPVGDAQPLGNPLGVDLSGDAAAPASLPRSAQEIERPILRRDASATTRLGTVTISQAPAYEQVALSTTLQALALASLVGIALAAIAGWWVSGRIVRPLRSLTDATDRMARGDLSARADTHGPHELGRLAASFNVMAVRVEDAVATMRRFVADAAHEIGTPLTALEADLELVRERGGSDEVRRLAGRALAQARRLESLGTNLLRLSRLEAAGPRDAGERLPPVDLRGIAAGIVDAAASRADQADVALALTPGSGPVAVPGDAEALAVAIGNLVDNALKFTPAAGRVEVLAEIDGAEAVVRVTDTGIGIPARDLPRLYERFHRGSNAGGVPGTGLGLAIVRATAVRHGGRVTAASTGHGATFELRIPVG